MCVQLASVFAETWPVQDSLSWDALPLCHMAFHHPRGQLGLVNMTAGQG